MTTTSQMSLRRRMRARVDGPDPTTITRIRAPLDPRAGPPGPGDTHYGWRYTLKRTTMTSPSTTS